VTKGDFKVHPPGIKGRKKSKK